MDKETILKISREENEGRHDEREILAFGKAARAGLLAGAIVCVMLVFAGKLIFHIPEIGLVGWFVYFAMQGSANIVLFRDLRKRYHLVWAIIELTCAAAFAFAAVFGSVMR